MKKNDDLNKILGLTFCVEECLKSLLDSSSFFL